MLIAMGREIRNIDSAYPVELFPCGLGTWHVGNSPQSLETRLCFFIRKQTMGNTRKGKSLGCLYIFGRSFSRFALTKRLIPTSCAFLKSDTSAAQEILDYQATLTCRSTFLTIIVKLMSLQDCSDHFLSADLHFTPASTCLKHFVSKLSPSAVPAPAVPPRGINGFPPTGVGLQSSGGVPHSF